MSLLDDDDLDLVAALQHAPRAPLSLLAEVLGVSASTVGRRLARLESDRLLRVIGQLDWSVSGEGHPWHVWVTAEPGRASEVAGRLAALPGTTLVAVTAGQADVYCSVLPERRAAVRDLLARSIPATPGVRSARSELVLSATTKSDAWRLPRLTEDQIHRLTAHAAQDTPTSAPPTPGTLTPDELRALRLLATDGRTTAAQISRRLDLGRSTAYRLTQSLLQRGLVRPRVEIEPSLLGYALEAVVALTVSPGAITKVAEALTGHPSARYVSTTAGHSCVVHQGVFRDEHGLAHFLTHDLAELPGVTSFDVSIVLEALRRHWLDRASGRLAAAADATDAPTSGLP
ncbi:Lrp/AsnC family transcriptional regulator [Streptomyces ferrugineus]|uniref:Lrp/AsnC family transcriptional regulator n=1 Tax=Streptomyces ferrugineus TaxID=1413221 RepID=A0A7M2SPT1_9ACTN|nr:Lrp/AsnC ligand binding domain-containing protein [Streptomyces ferrugineus]QOV38350.1 Lrp/AsnC family transcriptional regulator [Streptomyces ferrugineus]